MAVPCPAAQPAAVGGAAGRARVAVRALVRHRLGGARRQGAAAGARRAGSATSWRAAAAPGTAAVLRYYDHEFPLRAGTERLPLPELLDAQWYRLGWWRLARTELNYRRFFTISELIGGAGRGPGGLRRDPRARCCELLARRGRSTGCGSTTRTASPTPTAICGGCDEATGGPLDRRGEDPRRRRAAARRLAGRAGRPATTRCDHIDGLFTDPDGRGEAARRYRRLRRAPPDDRGGDWAATVRRAAYQVVTHELAAEVDAADPRRRADLRRRPRRCATTRPGRCARRCASCWSGCRSTARTSRAGRPGTPTPDAAMLTGPPRRPGRRSPCRRRPRAVDVVRDLALGRARRRARTTRDVLRPVRADRVRAARQVRRGHRLLPLRAAALGDRGGRRPGQPRGLPGGLPRLLRARLQRDWPATGTVLSTHDTKRSADVRARIAVLTECPARWADCWRSWRARPRRRARSAARLGGLADGGRPRAPRTRNGSVPARAEGGPGGGAAHHLDRAGRRRTRTR